jgi:hypothetical protein
MQKQKTKPLSRLVQEEVQKQLKRLEMSWTRQQFVNRLVEVLIPALKRHYRAVLGTLNSRVDQIEEWQKHEADYLSEFTDRLRAPTKAKGLNVRKAVDQALRELMQKDEAGRRIESRHFQATHKLDKLVPLPEDAHEAFLARVWEIVDTMFPESV